MLYSGTDPESYITEYTLVYEEKIERQVDLGCSLASRGRASLLLLFITLKPIVE